MGDPGRAGRGWGTPLGVAGAVLVPVYIPANPKPLDAYRILSDTLGQTLTYRKIMHDQGRTTGDFGRVGLVSERVGPPSGGAVEHGIAVEDGPGAGAGVSQSKAGAVSHHRHVMVRCAVCGGDYAARYKPLRPWPHKRGDGRCVGSEAPLDVAWVRRYVIWDE